MKFHTKKARFGLCIVFLAALLLSLNACGDTTDPYEPDPTPGNWDYEDYIDLDDLDITWVDPGIEHESLRFVAAGEGLYLLEATLANGLLQFGFMDGTGSITIPVTFDHANPFSDGLAYVESGGRGFFIDPSGAEVFDLGDYDSAMPFEFGFSRVTHTYMQQIEGGVALVHSFGLIDTSGNVILPAEFENAGAFANNTLWAVQDGQYAIFDSAGNPITPHEFDSIAYAGENLFAAQRGDRFGHIDRDANVVTPFEYDMVGHFSDERAFVVLDGLVGYVNPQGEVVIPIQFIGAEPFSEGRAAVSPYGGTYGFIDTEGEWVIDPIFQEVWCFEGGAAITIRMVASGITRTVTLDKYGEIVLTPPVTGYFRWRDTRIAYNNPSDGSVGVNFNLMALLDDEGNMLTGFIFNDILDFSEGLAVALRPTERVLYYGLINRYGAIIIPTIFAGLDVVDSSSAVIQTFETDPDTGATHARSRVGILALPDDAATIQPDPEEWDRDIV